MKLYHTEKGILLEHDAFYLIDSDWDVLINQIGLFERLHSLASTMSPISNAKEILENHLLPPVKNQEIWASGVTYFKSREARMEESKDAGGGDFYDRVYHAERPELFFKSPPYRAVGHQAKVRIRRDSAWNVPEPELTLVVNSNQEIIGYTIGNDMSSRDIEGENPLYLPQAKSYDGAAAVGPCVLVASSPLSLETRIQIAIARSGKVIFQEETTLAQLKRKPEQLVEYLFRETTFRHGVLLMTGTGIVPPDSFTLNHGDEISITIDHIGTLLNTVE
ncbi:MAG: fumarylacetoacetate hydrolase family protein [Bacteroidia bacterium]|nr:fumarylacetoacetate hydrolase family protein [Bacteroidia bacterium]